MGPGVMCSYWAVGALVAEVDVAVDVGAAVGVVAGFEVVATPTSAPSPIWEQPPVPRSWIPKLCLFLLK